MKIVMWNFRVDDSQVTHRYGMILGRDILSKPNLDLCLPDNTIRVNRGTYKGYTAPTKGVSNIYFKFSLYWLKYKRFQNKQQWEIKHILNTMQRTVLY